MLVGRRRERAILDRLLSTVRAGSGAALALSGEAGIGKSALLEYAVESAPDLRILRAAGVEAEMELAFAALHQLCGPLLDQRGRLPARQSDALATVFGLGPATPPDRLLLGLAVLSLLSEAASERPLLCVVDDAHWVDRASAAALGFAARRLLAEPVAMLIATREPSEEFRALPELVVEGLPDADARLLLRSAVDGPLDEQVRERIIAETRGNPLALLELPWGLTPVQLAGGFGLPAVLPIPRSLAQCYARRVEGLPEDARLLLLVAAADSTGDPSLVCRAAQRLGIREEAVAAVERAGLLEIGIGVRFRHPLVRSEVYGAASPRDRRMVHRMLAEVTDPQRDPDRRIWHLARATADPEEAVAAELERSAQRARERGGLAAAAAFLERAVDLTPDPTRRMGRLLLAAQSQHLAGATDAATRLLAIAEAGPLDELGHARLDLLRAHFAFARPGGTDATAMLRGAARRLQPLAPGLARMAHLEALCAAVCAGRLARDGDVAEVAADALAAPAPPGRSPRACDFLLDGLATLFVEGYAAALPTIRRALRAFLTEPCTEDTLRWMWFAGFVGAAVWDDDAWDQLSARHLQVVSESGALEVLKFPRCLRATVHTLAGELTTAESQVVATEAAGEACGTRFPGYGAIVLAAWRGDEEEVSELTRTITDDVVPRGEGIGLTAAHWANAVLLNGLGRHEEALSAAERASEGAEQVVFATWGLGELILAASRCGRADRAAETLERLSAQTRASGTDWALGMEAGLRALLSTGDAAERLHVEAIERLSRTRIRVELARAHLRYGEWLRRERRRTDARDQLRTAHAMLDAMGVEAFARRAETELLATGERVRRRAPGIPEQLTTQEAQVARLATEGLSNPEIATRLFISPRTAEYHLHKVFAKLGISSRIQLERALRQETTAMAAG